MKKILAVEDDPDLRDDILSAVDLAGLDRRQAVAVGSAIDAMSAVTEEGARTGTDEPPFHFAIVDLSLVRHGLDEEGVDLIRWLHTHGKSCHIIAVTSKKGDEGLARARQAGANFTLNRQIHDEKTWISRLAAMLRGAARVS